LLYFKFSYAAVFLQFGAAAIFLALLYMAQWRCCILSFLNEAIGAAVLE
jgi:hypothetical protein